MASFSTVINTDQPSPQAAVVPQVIQGSHMVAPSEFITIDPSQLVTEPSQIIVEPFQVASEQSVSEHSEVIDAVPMDTLPDFVTSPQPLVNAVNAIPDGPVPGVPYRVRNTTTVASGGRLRRNLIDGVPEMVVDIIEEETPVDLSEYINLDSEDDNNDSDSDNNNNNRSHISSSQKTADGCQDLSPPPPDSRQQHTGVGTTGGNPSQLKVVSSRTLPKLDVNKEDFPAWMTKKGQWKYLTSTAGAAAWEYLLRTYINQERRLKFTKMVSNPTRFFHTYNTKTI